jgi:hypothetical protein
VAITSCWAAKGGAGTTVVVAGIALARKGPTILVDLDGDLPAVLGLPEPAGQGLAEWFTSDARPTAVLHLAIAVNPSIHLIPRGAGVIDPAATRWPELADWFAGDRRHFVVDCGSAPPPLELAAAARRDGSGPRRELLVTRPCYLALRRACALGARPDGLIVVGGRDQSLGPGDAARSLGVPVLAQVADDPAVARAVNAGLLAVRVPGSLLRPLRAVTRPIQRVAA